MSVENRLWTLSKLEILELKNYHARSRSLLNEVGNILVDNWDEVKKNKLLTKSILWRIDDYLRILYERKEELRMAAVTAESGFYFENVVCDTLWNFVDLNLKRLGLREHLKRYRNRGIRNLVVTAKGWKKPWKPRFDLWMAVDEIPTTALEVKLDLHRDHLKDFPPVRETCSNREIDFYLVASSVGSVSGKGINFADKSIWIYPIGIWKTMKDKTYIVEDIRKPIEPLFEETLKAVLTKLGT